MIYQFTGAYGSLYKETRFSFEKDDIIYTGSSPENAPPGATILDEEACNFIKRDSPGLLVQVKDEKAKSPVTADTNQMVTEPGATQVVTQSDSVNGEELGETQGSSDEAIFSAEGLGVSENQFQAIVDAGIDLETLKLMTADEIAERVAGVGTATATKLKLNLGL